MGITIAVKDSDVRQRVLLFLLTIGLYRNTDDRGHCSTSGRDATVRSRCLPADTAQGKRCTRWRFGSDGCGKIRGTATLGRSCIESLIIYAAWNSSSRV